MSTKIKIGIAVAIILVLLVGLFLYITHENYMLLPDGTKVYGDIDQAHIVNYSVVTQTNRSGQYHTIGEDFVHSANASRYKVNVTIQNIKAHQIIGVNARFYDTNNTLLCTQHKSIEQSEVGGFYPNQTLYVEIMWPRNDPECAAQFDQAHHLNFKITADVELS